MLGRLVGAPLTSADSLSRVDRRLKQRGGRITMGTSRQIPLFVWRSATQIGRDSSAVVRDLIIVCMAGLLLGFLFEGTLEKVHAHVACARARGMPPSVASC